MLARSRFLSLTAAVALVVTGVSTLVLGPQSARAGVQPGVAPDFVLAPGTSTSKTYQRALIGSAELKGTPSGCREDPATKLTCAAVRIKLPEFKAGYFLRLSTSWLAENSTGVISIPDVDTYLFDSESGFFDPGAVGGAGGAMPEQILIKEAQIKQAEYDLVVQAFAGAITEFTVVAEYVNSAKGPTPAKADITLNTNQTVTKSFSSVLAGYTGGPLLYPVVNHAPDDCRSDPAYFALCDVYRLRLNRDMTPDALNLVVINLTWAARYTPDIGLAATAFGGLQLPNLDIMVWSAADTQLVRDSVGGQGSSVPERASLLATQDEYDIVIQVASGQVSEYVLTTSLSNEPPLKPGELLDEVTDFGGGAGAPGVFDNTGGGGSLFGPGANVLPELGLVPINVDPDISGIGAGIDEQFNPNQIALGGATRNTSAVSSPPSGIALVLGLVLAPVALSAFGIVFLRRRRNALI